MKDAIDSLGPDFIAALNQGKKGGLTEAREALEPLREYLLHCLGRERQPTLAHMLILADEAWVKVGGDESEGLLKVGRGLV